MARRPNPRLSSRVKRTRRPLVALVALVVALVVGYVVNAASSDDSGGHVSVPSGSVAPSVPRETGSVPASGSDGTVALSSLPAQAATTVRLIRAGGPFPYPRNDGVVFHNFEHVLPREADGYYHEYTVPTPGSDDRGARRIVLGRDGTYWYTGDHYETFERVDISA